MIVLGRLQRVKELSAESESLSIRVQTYHRGHLSLRPGTQVFLALYPGNEKSSSSSIIGKLPEIMGTTIHWQSWAYVVRISLTLHDRYGVVHQVLESVASHGGNVLYLDSSSIEQERYHQVEAVVDYRVLGARLPKGDAAALEGLVRGLLLADCHDSVARIDGRLKVKVNVMRALRRMDQALSRIADPRALVATCEVGEEGDIVIPPLISEDIDYQMRRSFPDHPPLSDQTRYLLTSDTKERTFHVHVLSKRQLVVWCAIRHFDRPGALAAITRCLRERRITILTSLNRLEAHLGQSWFEAVLAAEDWTRGDDTPIDDRLSGLRDEVRDLLLQGVPVEFNCDVYFRPAEADALVRVGSAPTDRPGIRFGVRPVAIPAWLRSRENALKAMDTQERPTFEPRPSAAQFLVGDADDDAPLDGGRTALAEGISEVSRVTGLRPRRLFLSIAHTEENEPLIRLVREVCDQSGFVCDVVESGERHTVVRAEVRSRIERATHFLGVWTQSRWERGGRQQAHRGRVHTSPVEDPKRADGREVVAPPRHRTRKWRPRPSPWCLWEIAVAEVLGRPFRVVVQEGMSFVDYEALYSASFALRFTRDRELTAFKTQIQKALSDFQRGL